MYHHCRIISGNASQLEFWAPFSCRRLGGDSCGGSCSGVLMGMDCLARSCRDGGQSGEAIDHYKHLVLAS
jgi:hypothetical protein